MPELFGPLPRHAIAGVPLIYAVAAPLVAGAIVAVLGPWIDERPAGRGLGHRIGARTDTVAAVGALVAALVVVAGLAEAAGSSSGLVVSPGWTLVRTGSIEATLGFDADVGRAAIALVLALGAAFVDLRGRPSRAPDAIDAGHGGGRAAWHSLALGAALAAVLADGMATALLALGGAIVATGAASIRGRWLPGAGAVLALALAGATLGWGLEGRWLDGLGGNFLSDYGPRFVAVRDAPPPAVRVRAAIGEAKGSVTMTSVPGTEVYVGVADDASLRGRNPIATSPFRAAPVAATLQKIAMIPGAAAIVGGDGLEIALADNIDIRAGDDVVVTPLGGTWTWRDVEAQLLLHEADGKHPVRSELAAKRLAGVAVPTAIAALVFLAAVLAWLDAPRRIVRALATRGALDAALVAATLAVATVAPAARLSALIPLSGAPALLLLAAALVIFGAFVASTRGPWLAAGAATLLVGAALAAVAADAPPALSLAIALLSAGALHFAEKDGPRAVSRWIAGPVGDDDPAPVLAAAPATEVAGAPPEEAVAPSKPKKKKSPKKPAEARS